MLVTWPLTFTFQVLWLEQVFDQGSAYTFGRINSDCWHLFTTPTNHFGGINHADQTFEVLMTDLDPEVMKYFYKHTSKDGRMATKVW